MDREEIKGAKEASTPLMQEVGSCQPRADWVAHAAVPLTPLEAGNRRRGYCNYVPLTIAEHKEYWQVRSGLILPAPWTTASSMRKKGAPYARISVSSPTENSEGSLSRVVPLCVLFEGHAVLRTTTQMLASRLLVEIEADLRKVVEMGKKGGGAASSSFFAGARLISLRKRDLVGGGVEWVPEDPPQSRRSTSPPRASAAPSPASTVPVGTLMNCRRLWSDPQCPGRKRVVPLRVPLLPAVTRRSSLPILKQSHRRGLSCKPNLPSGRTKKLNAIPLSKQVVTAQRSTCSKDGKKDNRKRKTTPPMAVVLKKRRA
jgi:hypothetical protein